MRVFVAKGLEPRIRGLLLGYTVQVAPQVYVTDVHSEGVHWVMDRVVESGKGSALLLEPDPRANLGYRVRGFGDLWDSMVMIDDLLMKPGGKS